MKPSDTAAFAGLGIVIAVLIIMAKLHPQTKFVEPVRLCENTTGFWLTPDTYAGAGFPEWVPCRWLKLEQDV